MMQNRGISFFELFLHDAHKTEMFPEWEPFPFQQGAEIFFLTH